MVRWVVRSILQWVDRLSYFSFQRVLHDWYNKGRGMYYSVCGMMHIKEPLLLIGKSSLYGGSGFSFSLSEWSFTICLTPYNRKWNVWSVSLNKIFPSFLLLNDFYDIVYVAIFQWCKWCLMCSQSEIESCNSDIRIRKEGNILFNDALNIFYLR